MPGISNPQITVIIAVLNGANTLKRCLTSIFSQSYQQKEVLIIDGSSTDGSVEILKSYDDRITYWESCPDNGIYHAWNKALKHTHGEWICFLGADDFFWSDNVLSEIAPYLIKAQNDDIRIVYGQIAKINAHKQILKQEGKTWAKIQWQMLHGMPRDLPHPGLMHHHTLFEDHGLFDETFKIAGDYELLLRELRNSTALFVDNLLTVGHQEGGIADTFKTAAQMEVARARQKNGLGAFSWLWTVIFIRTLFQNIWYMLTGK